MRRLKNSWTGIGNLGKDAEVRVLDGGKGMITFPFATSDTYVNSVGKDVTETQWHNIIAFRKDAQTAEKLAQYLTKGTSLTISGAVRYKKVEREIGGEKVTYMDTSILLDELVFHGSKSADNSAQEEATQEP